MLKIVLANTMDVWNAFSYLFCSFLSSLMLRVVMLVFPFPLAIQLASGNEFSLKKECGYESLVGMLARCGYELFRRKESILRTRREAGRT